jgi:hypothetical protein
MNIAKTELGLLCLNLVVLGGILVLIALRGPSIPAVLLAVGSAGGAIAKVSKALIAQSDGAATE